MGTPKEIAEIIRQEHAAAPDERHFFFPIWSGVEVDMATRSVKLYAEEVVPLLYDRQG